MRAKQKKDFRSHRLISNITIVLVGITTISSIIISNINNNKANAVDANSTATIRVKSTCSMTATVDTAHTATLINGIYSGDYVDTTDNNNKPYENGIGQTTIQTFCNDPYGYAIYAIGYTGGEEGITNGTNTMLHSIDIGNSNYDIVTGTATSGDTSNWSMKLAAVDGTYEPAILNDYDDYHAVPANYEKVAEYGSGTDLTEVGSSLTTTYAAYISNTQPAGTYTGQVKYVLVHPATSLEPGTYYMQDVDIWGNQISVGEEIVAYDNRDNKSYTVRRMCMSGTMDSCNYEDSMLWMTQNLDLDIRSSVALNSINTDLNSSGSGVYTNGYVQGDGIIYYTPAYSTTKEFSYGPHFSGHSGTNSPFSADPDAENPSGTHWYFNGVFNNVLYNPDVCTNNNNQTCNFLDTSRQSDYFKKSPYEYNGSHGKVGNYYNWPAAIASNNSASFTQNTYTNGNVSENPSNSICPRGWRLPRMANPVDYIQYNEFMQLNSVYNGGNVGDGAAIDGLIMDPVYMTLAGNVNVGNNPTINGAGYYGGYWSSTGRSGDWSYFLYIGGTNIWVSNTSYDRGFGLNIRCVSEYK